MDHEGGAPPPFWFQPPPTTLLRQRRRSSSPTLNPVAMIIIVPILALILIAFILIPLLSSVSQFLKAPSSLKKGWDSLNIVLVLFAVLCGVFLRQNNDDASVPGAVETMNNPVTENDQKAYHNSPERARHGKLMRSSSSYPDLRQESSLWQSGDRPYRFYDDFDLNIYNRSALEYSPDDSDIKDIPVDTPAITLAPPQAAPQQPREKEDQTAQQPHEQPKEDQTPQQPQQEALLQQPQPVKLKRRRSARNSAKESVKRRTESNHLDKTDTMAAPPPPPPPPPMAVQRREEKSEMLERKKSGATKEIATAIASLYNRTKMRKKHKIRNIYDDATTPTSPPPTKSSITPSTPPPPPPPPPPSVFHHMFKKANKSKKIHSVYPSVQSPPPPPPPPNSIFNNIFKNSSKSKRFNSNSTTIPTPPPPPPPSNFSKPAKTSKRSISTSSSPPPPPQPQSRHRKPPLPTKTSIYYENTGSQSPVVPIPPPPPPPPFKMQQVKFEARGDFVRIKSNHGSRSTSPELEDVELASKSETPRAVDGGAKEGSSVFCPSPDVNTKADNFIARLRDEWRLEKINSIRAKQ